MKGRFLRVSGFFGRFRFFSPVECCAFANCERKEESFIEEIYRINDLFVKIRIIILEMIASFKKIDRSEYFVCRYFTGGYFYKIIRGNFGICVKKKNIVKKFTREQCTITVSFRPYYTFIIRR